MDVTFLVPSTTRAIGGVISVYEFANGLSRRGHGVHLVHLPVVEGHIDELDDIAWFTFAPAIEHHLVRSLDDVQLPDADFIELTGWKFFPDAWPAGTAEDLLTPEAGLPFLFVQAYKYLAPHIEEEAIRTPCPKICIAHWMVDALAEQGVPRAQLAFVPYGLDHAAYRLVRPISDRPLQISMLYNAHPVKGARFGVAAIEEVQRRVPGTSAVVFSNKDPAEPLPPSIEFVNSPPKDFLVEQIYNGSRVFICSSIHEGFGMCAIEAMAGGCALVTTANGGSDDYAFGGDNALVCAPRDVAGMADRIERLLRDDQLSTRIATRGNEFVQRYDWDDSARQLEEFLERYARDPLAMQKN
jgi:glycosyltransferase involved in cell wall biosynthesis